LRKLLHFQRRTVIISFNYSLPVPLRWESIAVVNFGELFNVDTYEFTTSS